MVEPTITSASTEEEEKKQEWLQKKSVLLEFVISFQLSVCFCPNDKDETIQKCKMGEGKKLKHVEVSA